METTTPTPAPAPGRQTRLLRWIAVVTIAVAAYFWWAHETTDPAFGRYEGDVVAKWITDDLEMELVEPFVYVDAAGKRWTAPKGSVINGASIPSMFWSVIGGPFEGRFRKASVLHDAACDEKAESWESVHRMFYDACRCSRVGVGKAQTMYWAVYHFGPRWTEDGRDAPMGGALEDSVIPKAERYFDKKEFTPAEIEACSVEDIENEVAKWDAAKAAASAPADAAKE
jgi:hypothetical protein